jgi:biotin carboxyl carrier protein
MLAPNTILQNRYRMIRELGHGGMGTVYEALDQRVNCLVALKEMLGTRDGEARKAFEREAALLANLRHQALPKVMDYFSENEGDFLVMEFIAGHDLAALLASRGGPFAQSQVLSWADELLKLLEYLHTRQPPILHRDIKPANLKLTDQGEIFLLDFGLAKGATGQMLTLATSRSVFGYTPSYASLEQIHGQGTDARSDIYSLGATLYHLLTGITPIDAPTRFHIVEDEQPDPLLPIDRVNPQASSGVATVIHQAMAIARKQRPASAPEMRKALRNAAEEDARRTAEEELRARAEGTHRVAEDVRVRREAEERNRVEEARYLLHQDTPMQVAAQPSRRRAKLEVARLNAEEEARLLVEAEQRSKAEEDARCQLVIEGQRLKLETERRAEEERLAESRAVEEQIQAAEQARPQAEETERCLAELESVKEKAQQDARGRAEKEQRIKTEILALVQAEEEQCTRIEAEIKRRAEAEVRLAQAEAEARGVSGETRSRPQEQARPRGEVETYLREEEALLRAEQQTHAQVEAEEEASKREDQEKKIRVEIESLKRAENELRRRREQPLRQVEIVVPQMGESITEGTITKWLKRVGEDVERDEPLFEISTDKVDAEVPSPAAGVLIEIRFKEGETVAVNTTVAVLKQG